MYIYYDSVQVAPFRAAKQAALRALRRQLSEGHRILEENETGGPYLLSSVGTRTRVRKAASSGKDEMSSRIIGSKDIDLEVE